MADFSTLKAYIASYVKQNGVGAITGEILQDVLVEMVEAIGDEALNSLASALGDEITNRQNAVAGEAETRGNADTALQNAINAINTKLSEGYVYAGVATTTTNPGTPTGKVFYFALAAGTYTYYVDSGAASIILTQGISILKYNGTAWSSEQLAAIDDAPTEGSSAVVKSGGVFTAIAAVLNKVADGYLYRGIATTSTNPPTPQTKVFYIATAAGTYTNFGALVVTQGINILKYDGSAWSQEQLIGMAEIYRNPLMGYYLCETVGGTAAKMVTANGYVLPTSGGCVKIKFTEKNTAENPTLNINNTGAKPLYYAGAIASASNTWEDGETIEVYYDGTNYMGNKVGGDRLPVDDVPTAGSNNLVKSGGVYQAISSQGYVIPGSRVQNGESIMGSAVYGIIQVTNNSVVFLDGGAHHQIRNFAVSESNNRGGLYFSGVFEKYSYLNPDSPTSNTSWFNVVIVGADDQIYYKGRLTGRNTVYVPNGCKVSLTAENLEKGLSYECLNREIVKINNVTPLATNLSVSTEANSWLIENEKNYVVTETLNGYKSLIGYEVTNDGWIGGVFGENVIRFNFAVVSHSETSQGGSKKDCVLEKYIFNGLTFIRVFKGDFLCLALPTANNLMFIGNYDKTFIEQMSKDAKAGEIDRTNVVIPYSRFILSADVSSCMSYDLFKFDGKPAKCYCVDTTRSGTVYQMIAYLYDKDKNEIGIGNWHDGGFSISPTANAVYYGIRLAKKNGSNYETMTQADLSKLQVYVDRLPAEEYLFSINLKTFHLLGTINGMTNQAYCKWGSMNVVIRAYHSDGRELRAMVFQYDKDFNPLSYHNAWSRNYTDTPIEGAVYFDIRIAKRNADNTDYDVITDEDLAKITVYCNYISPCVNLTVNALGDSITAEGKVTSALSAYGLRVNNYGVSGTDISGGGDSFINRYASMTDNCDVILVIGGVNDWRTGVPLGTFEDGDDSTTFYGALHILCSGLKDKYTNLDSNKIIYMGTPMHNQFSLSGYPDLPEFVIENGKIVPQSYGGGYLKQYVDAIKEVAQYYAIKVIDLYSVSGIAPIQSDNKSKYTNDGLHPNTAGGKLIAEAILRGLGLLS